MPEPAQRLATYADLRAVPEHLVAELIAGSLYTHPRPAPAHVSASSVLGGDLNRSYQRGRGGPGGWWILDEPELHLGDDVLVPDIAGWRRSRLPALPEQPFFALAPDWVCEVLSPSNGFHDRARKMPRYATAGVGWAWLVDPREQTVEVFENVDGAWVQRQVVGRDQTVTLPPFEQLELALSDLWNTGTP
jgi:Uma2 family endonuclease